MKSILLLSLLFTSIAKADTLRLPLKDSKIFYEKVFSDSGSSKEVIYAKVKSVFLRLFPASKDVIQSEDPVSGKIVGKGNFTFTYKATLGVIVNSTNKFTLDITVKDNKYRVQMYDFFTAAQLTNQKDQPFEVSYDFYLNKPKPYTVRYIEAFHQRVTEIFNQVEKEMSKKVDNDF